MSETNQDTEAATKPKGAGKVKWIVGAILLIFATAVAMNLPRGYSDDLSRVGKGKAAVVLIRDKNAVESFALMEVMNSIRDQYAGQVEFLLTDFNTPEGRAFMSSSGAQKVTMVVLDGSGKMEKILYPPQTAGSVQQAIAGVLGTAQ